MSWDRIRAMYTDDQIAKMVTTWENIYADATTGEWVLVRPRSIISTTYPYQWSVVTENLKEVLDDISNHRLVDRDELMWEGRHTRTEKENSNG